MKELKLEIPAGCEVDKIETQDGHIVVTFREKERELPKSWEEFCEMFPITAYEHYIDRDSSIECAFDCADESHERLPMLDKNILPNSPTSHAVLALCQLIQLRNCYNGGWKPDWNKSTDKFVIDFCRDGDLRTFYAQGEVALLAFKDEKTADEFLKYFRPLIEKLKPLYGIKEGGAE